MGRGGGVTMKDTLNIWFRQTLFHLRALGKWLLLGMVTGIACGLAVTLLRAGTESATALRAGRPWLLFGLPLAGLAIVGLYKLTKTEGRGTDDILTAVQRDTLVPPLLLPAILLGTVLTHLFGGSAGRMGAALQMGGAAGCCAGRLFRLDGPDARVVIQCGMAASFAALFGTPLTAAVFALTVISVGSFSLAALVPCLTAALTSYILSLALGLEPMRFAVTAPALETGTLLRAALLGILCALVSTLFCRAVRAAGGALKKHIPNVWLRSVIGGLAVILLTLLIGSQDYNGTSMAMTTRAIEGRSAPGWAFLAKILFTAVTLGAGFKGGEIAPLFCVGSTFGCAVGPLLGIPPGFAAAVGLAAVFCGAANCPLASIFLSVELFGAEGLPYFALACGVSFALSGRKGLYAAQAIPNDKLKAQSVNSQTAEDPARDLTAVH